MRNTAKSQEAGEKNRSVRARYKSIAPLRKRSFFIALCAALLTLMIPVLIYVYIVFSKDGFAAVVLIPAAAAAALTAALIVLIARQEKINSLLEETVAVLEYNDRYLYRFNRRMAAHTRPAASAVFAGAAAFCGLAGGLAVSAPGSASVAEGFFIALGVFAALTLLALPVVRVFFNYQLCRAFGGDRYIVLSRRGVLSAGRMISLSAGRRTLYNAELKRSCGCDCLRLNCHVSRGYGECVRSEDIPLPPNTSEEFANRLLEIYNSPSLSDHEERSGREKRQEAAKPKE